MSSATSSNPLIEWVSANLVAVMGFVAMAVMAWATLGQVQARVDENQREILQRLDAIDARLTEQDEARACLIRNVDRLADRAGVTLPCRKGME